VIEPVPVPLADRIATLVAEGGGTIPAGQVASRFGVSRSLVYRDWTKSPDWPQPINPGCRPLLYLSNDVAAWVAARK
jgi:predicted DNA-binding transcriptional regulator AlpA